MAAEHNNLLQVKGEKITEEMDLIYSLRPKKNVNLASREVKHF